jgi:mannose-6-phosphate isomerase-like protein (cupin superfamily)
MDGFDTKRLPEGIDDIAPDGSNVRILRGLPRGGMAHFELAPADTSTAVTHRTVEEIWYFLAGRGEMWRKLNAHEEVVSIEPETCVTLPLGTHFQFQSTGDVPLTALGVTMPPWPGESEALQVDGRWTPTDPSHPEPGNRHPPSQ